jgi:hypothetical protein
MSRLFDIVDLERWTYGFKYPGQNENASSAPNKAPDVVAAMVTRSVGE